MDIEYIVFGSDGARIEPVYEHDTVKWNLSPGKYWMLCKNRVGTGIIVHELSASNFLVDDDGTGFVLSDMPASVLIAAADFRVNHI